MTRISTVALACACVLASSSAMAYSEASASLTGLTFTLIDLDPYDAITPSFNFVPPNGGVTTLKASAVDNDLGLNDSKTQTQPGSYTFSGTLQATVPGTSATASIDAPNYALGASGQGSGPDGGYNAMAEISPGTGYWNISVSPRSALLISGVVSLSVSASNSPCSAPACLYDQEIAQALAGLSLWYAYANSQTQVYYEVIDRGELTAQSRGQWYETQWVYNPATQSYESVQVLRDAFNESRSLQQGVSVNLVNLTGEELRGRFNAFATVSGYASAPVPEAGTVTMALAGLGLLAFMRRRWRVS